jgi:hypothetical protein
MQNAAWEEQLFVIIVRHDHPPVGSPAARGDLFGAPFDRISGQQIPATSHML